MAKATTMSGVITQIVGVVVDVEFGAGLPAIYDAITVPHGNVTLYLEVAQHLSETTVRAIALGSTDGLKRGQAATSLGTPITIAVGDATIGRMFNVVGEPIDGKPAITSETMAS